MAIDLGLFQEIREREQTQKARGWYKNNPAGYEKHLREEWLKKTGKKELRCLLVKEAKVENKLVLPAEQVVAAYKTYRGSATLTTKRMLISESDNEGYSLPWSSVVMWDRKKAGYEYEEHGGFSFVVTLQTSAMRVVIGLCKDIDVRRFELLLAQAIL